MSKKLWTLAATSGILLSIPFLIPHTGWTALFAFVPLFIAEALFKANRNSASASSHGESHGYETVPSGRSTSRNSAFSKQEKLQHKQRRRWLKKFWPKALLTFLIWNAATTFWVWNATPAGALCAIVLNSLQMLAIFQIFRLTAKICGLKCSSANGGIGGSGAAILSGGPVQPMTCLPDNSARHFNAFPYFVFAALWIGWEHIYFTWNISWPWLNLGNSFARTTSLIQWYEYTGVEGGSLWILLSNILIFRIVMLAVPSLTAMPSAAGCASNTDVKHAERASSSDSAVNKISYDVPELRKYCILAAVVILVPVIISLVKYFSFQEDDSAGRADFVVLQPNIDPYSDKFSGMSQSQQSSKLISIADSVLPSENMVPGAEAVDGTLPVNVHDSMAMASSGAEYIVVAPETFLYPHSWDEAIWENIPFASESFLQIHNWAGRHTGMNLIIGAGTYRKFDTNPLRHTAIYLQGQKCWFESYNSALFFGSRGEFDIYHKSKLVTVVESTPWPALMKWLENKGVTLAGSFGNYGVQQSRSVFTIPLGCSESTFGNTAGSVEQINSSGHLQSSDAVAKVGCAICYESVFGDYYREWVAAGANVMTIITNDGWWGNTPGYMQHLSYASLRAIETRRAIARSANTGISAFVNQRGDIVERTEWWEDGALKASLPLSGRLTVFVQYGDVIGRVAKFISMLLLLMLAVSVVMRRKELRVAKAGRR